jgi:hypothetical protein
VEERVVAELPAGYRAFYQGALRTPIGEEGARAERPVAGLVMHVLAARHGECREGDKEAGAKA